MDQLDGLDRAANGGITGADVFEEGVQGRRR